MFERVPQKIEQGQLGWGLFTKLARSATEPRSALYADHTTDAFATRVRRDENATSLPDGFQCFLRSKDRLLSTSFGLSWIAIRIWRQVVLSTAGRTAEHDPRPRVASRNPH